MGDECESFLFWRLIVFFFLVELKLGVVLVGFFDLEVISLVDYVCSWLYFILKNVFW